MATFNVIEGQDKQALFTSESLAEAIEGARHAVALGSKDVRLCDASDRERRWSIADAQRRLADEIPTPRWIRVESREVHQDDDDGFDIRPAPVLWCIELPGGALYRTDGGGLAFVPRSAADAVDP